MLGFLIAGSMKILWLSNKLLTGFDDGSTGTWLDSMSEGIMQSGEVTLGNITMGVLRT